MSEIEKELLKEIKEKKVIAHSAAKRVSKTRKCTMPYEMMSTKERRKYMEPSEVTTFKLQPMSLKEYNAVAGDKKRELLMWYGEKYGWTPAGVAAALGCDYTTAQKKLSEFMLLPTFKARKKSTDRATAAEQMERRKALSESAPEPTLQTICVEPETPPQRVSEPPEATFTLSFNCAKNGALLRDQLMGVAEALDRYEMYEVSLTIRSKESPELCREVEPLAAV